MRRFGSMPTQVWVFSVIAFIVMVGFGVVIPVLPLFARSFGVSQFAVGAVVSLFALMRLLFAPAVPLIGRKVSYSTTLSAGIFIVAASSAACGAANHYWQVLLMRGLGGIGSAMFSVSAMTILIATVDASRLGRASALFSGGYLLGGMTGPAIGGIFSRVSLAAPFFFYAATLVGAGLVAVFFIKEPISLTRIRQTKLTEGPTETTSDGRDDTTSDGPTPITVPLTQAIKDRRYQSACYTNFASGWQSQGVRSLLVPTYVTAVLGLEPEFTGYAIAIAAVVQGLVMLPVGTAVDRIGRKPMMILGAAITATASAVTPWAPSFTVLTILLCIYGVGATMQSTAPSALVGDVVGHGGGQAVSVFQQSGDVGAIIGPLVAGWMADRFSLQMPFVFGSLLMAGAIVLSVTMPRRESKRPAE